MPRKLRGDDYRFLQIEDAVLAINQRVNLIGVVIESSIPRKTKGTDCLCNLAIMDESRPSPGISVNIFAETMEKLPQVECIGDIIQLSHVLMKLRGRQVYAVFNKKFSSFALYEGKNSKSCVPYQVSSKFRARDQDKKFIAGLRQWLGDNQLDTGRNSLQLKEMRENERINLVCKVLHICEVTKDEWMLFVWDGTDTPPVSISKNLEDEIEDPLPLHFESSPLARDVLCMFPTVGTVLRVVVDSGNQKLELNVLKTGSWVKIIDMKCEIHEGLWYGVLMPSSRLRHLIDDDKLVLMCQRIYDERLNLKFGRMPTSSFPWPSYITETDYPDVPFSTLMDVHAYPEATAKFKCVVRVLAVFPGWAEDFCSPSGTLRIRLTLEDPTARICAFLYAEDGVHFFGGSQSTDEMTRKRNLLLGISEGNVSKELKDAPRDAPWIQCCLKSYYLDKNNTWESRRYRIFATRLVNE